MRKSDFAFIFKSFLVWRVLLFVFAFLATLIIINFGNRFPYVDRVLTATHLPGWIWGFGNFDGVHYLRLAQNGYNAQFTQAFFPLYPLAIRLLNFIPKVQGLDVQYFTDPSFFYTALILSAVFFLPALYFLFRLWKDEYSSGIAIVSIILLLTFPTAFYFGSVYSEALFLLLVVLTFWFVRKNNFILAGVFAALASATKIQGAMLFVFLAVELWEKYKGRIVRTGRQFWLDLLGVLVSPLGLLAYMYYLYRVFGNPIYFLTAQSVFGAERSSVPLVLLPQVVYRYFKMFLALPPAGLAFWIAALEFFITLVLIAGIILTFRKIRFSYWLFVTLTFLLPTLTGTLLSMPRFALLAFPLLPQVAKFNKAAGYIIIGQTILQIVLLSLFIRGYWVA
jgi:Gpi18-like mannosyltransferase